MQSRKTVLEPDAWNVIIWQMKHDEAHNTLTSCLFVNENKNCVTDVLSSKDFRMKHPIDLQAIEIDSEVLLGRLSLHSAFLSHGVCVCVLCTSMVAACHQLQL